MTTTPEPHSSAPAGGSAGASAGASADTSVGAPTASPSKATAVAQVVRSIGHLAVVVVVGIWAFTDWQLPWPGIATGVGCVLLAVLIWAVFLSPRPVLHTDRFGLALIELLFLGAGAFAMLALGFHWSIVAAFGVITAALGYFVPERLRSR